MEPAGCRASSRTVNAPSCRNPLRDLSSCRDAHLVLERAIVASMASMSSVYRAESARLMVRSHISPVSAYNQSISRPLEWIGAGLQAEHLLLSATNYRTRTPLSTSRTSHLRLGLDGSISLPHRLCNCRLPPSEMLSNRRSS